MLKMEPQSRFKDVVKKNICRVGVIKEDARDRAGQGQMIHCGGVVSFFFFKN